MKQTQKRHLSIVPGGVPELIHVKQYDSGRVLSFEIYDEIGLTDLSGVGNVQLNLLRADKTAVVKDKLRDGVCTYDAATSTVSVTVTQTMTEIAGRAVAEIVLYGAVDEAVITAINAAIQNGDRAALAAALNAQETKRIATATFIIVVEPAAAALRATLADEINGLTTSWRGLSYIFKYPFTPSGELIGDITGDGDVNNLDLVAWSRLLSGLPTVGSIAAGDIDGDGDTDNADVVKFANIVQFEKPTDWNIIKLELFYTDNSMRTVYMYENFQFYTAEEQLRDLEIGRAAARAAAEEESGNESNTGN